MAGESPTPGHYELMVASGLNAAEAELVWARMHAGESIGDALAAVKTAQAVVPAGGGNGTAGTTKRVLRPYRVEAT